MRSPHEPRRATLMPADRARVRAGRRQFGQKIRQPTCVVFFVAIFIMRQILEAPFGYTLRMLRDNTERARALGVPVERYKLAAFVIAGVFAAVAGVLMSLYVSGAYPNFAFWTQSGEAIFMIMLGGISVFLGPIVGAAAFLLLNDMITRYTEYNGFFMGIVLLCVVLGLREGLLDVVVHRLRRSPALESRPRA